MRSPAPTRREQFPVEHQLLLAPLAPRKCLGLPPPGRESPLTPEALSARAVVITTVMWEILARTEPIPHGGIND